MSLSLSSLRPRKAGKMVPSSLIRSRDSDKSSIYPQDKNYVFVRLQPVLLVGARRRASLRPRFAGAEARMDKNYVFVRLPPLAEARKPGCNRQIITT